MCGPLPRPSSQAQRGAKLSRTPTNFASTRHGFERHLLRPVLCLFFPLRKQPRIVLRDVIRRRYAELLRRSINPAWCTFDLTEISYRRLVHNHLPLAIRPLGAKFFVVERWRVSQRAQDQIHLPTIIHGRFQLESTAMPTNFPLGFMRQRPRRAVLADPQKFLASTEHFTREVVQSIQLVRSRRQQTKSS